MPLHFQENINPTTRLAVWKIDEPEELFTAKVPLKRNISHVHKRLQHLAGRYLLPLLFEDFPHAEIEIADTRKPFLPNEQYHFSISHSGEFAAAIVSKDERVGIDAEVTTPRVERIKHKFLHADELRFVHAQLPSTQVAHLMIMWCAKEAMFKWYGLGDVDFSDVMRIFPFAFNDAGELQAAFMKDDFQQKITLQYKIIEGLTIVWVNTTP